MLPFLQPNPKKRRDKMVKIYTKNDCVACRQTKKTMDKKGIPYEEVNVEDDIEELEALREEGWYQLPIVKTPTNMWSGFRLEEINKLT